MNRVLSIALFLYFFLFSYYVVTGYKEAIPAYMLWLETVFSVVYVFFIYISSRINKMRYILPLIFAVSAVMAFSTRAAFLADDPSMPFGPALGDGYGYHDQGLLYVGKSYGEVLKYIWTFTNDNIDDLGYPTILYLVYNLCNDETASLNFMIFLNAAVIMVSAFYFFRFLRLLAIDKKTTCIYTSVWGFSPFLSTIAAVGLKENIFCLLVIMAFYYMYRYKNSGGVSNLILALVSIVACYFFRVALALMLVISLFAIFVANEKNRKKLLWIGLAGMVVGLVFIDIILARFTHMSLSQVLEMSNSRFGVVSDNSSFNWMTQVVGALMGPFPNFNRTNGYAIIFNGALIVKVLLSYHFILGMWYVMRGYVYKLYPMMVFIFMGFVMWILSAVSLDMRYQITFIPIIFALCAIMDSEKRIKLDWKYYAYVVMATMVIILYNGR